MACGSHDGALGRSVQRRLRRHASADAMARDVGCIHAGPRRSGFEDCCDRVAMQSSGSYVAVTIGSAKDGALGDLSLGQAPVADPFLQMITLVMREECCSRPISLKVRQREG
jgi:hypothetical protein